MSSPDQIHCTASDDDGIKRIRVIDKDTKVLVKVVKVSCGPPTTDQRGFSFDDVGDHYRVQVLDCKGSTAAYNVNL